MAPTSPEWWKDIVVYQIWPASYKDSNGDGLGDLQGIIGTLDYLKDLGVTCIWLSPMYASPQYDMGYDISNYEDIYPPYGTMADMDELIRQVHARGMKMVLDLVINHCSSEHAWFQESKKDKTNPKADWFHWRPPRMIDGKRHPPNNWRAIFGGSAWDYVPERDEYYLHLFEPEQPDLNWENPVSRQAVYDSAIRFWLKKGIDGFRVDVANMYSKNLDFPDVPAEDIGAEFLLGDYNNGPRIHEYYREIRRDVLNEFGEVLMIGECAFTPFDEVLKYVSAERKEMDMIFDFDIVTLGGNMVKPRHEMFRQSLQDFKSAILKVQQFSAGTDAWATVFGENHDNGRSIPRFATDDPEYRVKAGKLLAMLFGTLTGTLFIYQGQEIGMTNIPQDWTIDDLKDISALKYWREIIAKYPDDKELHQRGLRGLQLGGRDNARTPVQWNSEANAGFTTGTPWMRVHDNYKEVNVEAQLDDPESLLSFWKQVVKLRKSHSELFVHGDFEIHDFDDENVFTYTKKARDGKNKALVVLNFTENDQSFRLPEGVENSKLELLVSNVDEPKDKLSAWEGRVYVFE